MYYNEISILWWVYYYYEHFMISMTWAFHTVPSWPGSHRQGGQLYGYTMTFWHGQTPLVGGMRWYPGRGRPGRGLILLIITPFRHGRAACIWCIYVMRMSTSKMARMISFMIIRQIQIFHVDVITILLMFSFIVYASHTQYNIRTDVLSSDAVFMPTGRQREELGPDPQ